MYFITEVCVSVLLAGMPLWCECCSIKASNQMRPHLTVRHNECASTVLKVIPFDMRETIDLNYMTTNLRDMTKM